MSTTIPPILLRNTYPPGQPEIGAAPTPTGAAPTNLNQIMFPGDTLATLFQGPVISGPVPGVQGAAGTAVLCLALQVDYSQGNYNLAIQFPGGCFLQSFNAVVYQAGLAATVVNFGSAQGGSDIFVVTVPPPGTVLPPEPPLAQLPMWSATNPFQIWMGVTGNTGNTAGGAIILIEYVRIAGPWSPPSANFNP